MEMWSWLKKIFTPTAGAGGRTSDSQLNWTSSSNRSDERDVFDDTYFSASDDQGGGSSDCSSSSDSSSDSGGDGGSGSD